MDRSDGKEGGGEGCGVTEGEGREGWYGCREGGVEKLRGTVEREGRWQEKGSVGRKVEEGGLGYSSLFVRGEKGNRWTFLLFHFCSCFFFVNFFISIFLALLFFFSWAL